MSPLWSPGEDLVGRWDPGARLYVVTGWAYGPAGPAQVEVASGVVLAVDYADPSATNEITVEAPLTGDPAALDPVTRLAAEALLGPEAMERLRELPTRDEPDRPVRISGPGYRSADNQATGRLALLVEVTGDPDLTPLQVAVARLEAAALASVADPGLGVLAGLAESLAREGLAVLMDSVEHDAVTIDDPALRSELTATLRRVAEVIGDDLTRRRLRRLVEDLEQGRFRPSRPSPQVAATAAPAGSALPPTAPRTAAAARKRLAEGVTPPPDILVEGPDGTRAWRTNSTEVRVSAPGPSDGRWTRVFRRRDGLLLALAPLVDSSGMSTGHLVVPGGIDRGELLLDVTHTPEAPRPSSALATVRNAVASGRRACQLERVGDKESAARIWQVCAAQWAAADDPTRAGIAERYAQGNRFDPRTPRPGRGRRQSNTQAPLLSDRI